MGSIRVLHILLCLVFQISSPPTLLNLIQFKGNDSVQFPMLGESNGPFLFCGRISFRKYLLKLSTKLFQYMWSPFLSVAAGDLGIVSICEGIVRNTYLCEKYIHTLGNWSRKVTLHFSNESFIFPHVRKKAQTGTSLVPGLSCCGFHLH